MQTSQQKKNFTVIFTLRWIYKLLNAEGINLGNCYFEVDCYYSTASRKLLVKWHALKRIKCWLWRKYKAAVFREMQFLQPRLWNFLFFSYQNTSMKCLSFVINRLNPILASGQSTDPTDPLIVTTEIFRGKTSWKILNVITKQTCRFF